jgi:hypothetical protein
VNFGLQVLVIIIRMAVVAYIIWSFTREFQDSELASNRICQLATIVLSTLSLSPLFHMSLKSSWLINMRPMDVRGGTAAQGGNRVHAGQEVSMRIIMKIGAAVCLILVMMASFLIDEFPFVHGLLMMDADFFTLL